MTVDRRRALIWIGDVGQSRQEEVDVVAQSTRGANLGWSCYEGFQLFNRATLTSFGEDFAGEIWAVTIDGRLWSMSARVV